MPACAACASTSCATSAVHPICPRCGPSPVRSLRWAGTCSCIWMRKTWSPIGAFLDSLPVPFVIDHMGRTLVEDGPDQPALAQLLDLLKDERAWVKLSGPERISDCLSRGNFPYADVVPYAQRLMATAPDRVLWGTDWPHPNVREMPDDGWLVDLLPHYGDPQALAQAAGGQPHAAVLVRLSSLFNFTDKDSLHELHHSRYRRLRRSRQDLRSRPAGQGRHRRHLRVGRELPGSLPSQRPSSRMPTPMACGR